MSEPENDIVQLVQSVFMANGGNVEATVAAFRREFEAGYALNRPNRSVTIALLDLGVREVVKTLAQASDPKPPSDAEPGATFHKWADDDEREMDGRP